MISLAAKAVLLFSNQVDRTNYISMGYTQRLTNARAVVHDVVAGSSAMGLEGTSEKELTLTEEQMLSGVPVVFDLLQVRYPISVRATVQRTGYVSDNAVSVTVRINLCDPKPSYVIEHNLCEVFVESVTLPRLYKRLERILKDTPSICGHALAV